MQQLLTRALRESNYHAKSAEFDRTNPTSVIKRGMGLSLPSCMARALPGRGERRLNSLVKIELTHEGQPRILVSSTEFGQGTNTILSQVCAQALRIPYEEVLVRSARYADRSQLGPNCRQSHGHDCGQAGGTPLSESLLAALAPFLPSGDAGG